MNRTQFPARNMRRGFTLVEAIATIVILAIIGSIASVIILTAVDGYVDAATTAQLHIEASTAMDRIVRELRRVGLDGGAVGVAPDINDVTPTSITWGANGELSLTGNKLQLTTSGPPLGDLLEDVSAFTIQTYDEDNATLAATLTGAACDPIRRIELGLTLQRSGVSTSLRTRLFVRSTMSGGGT